MRSGVAIDQRRAWTVVALLFFYSVINFFDKLVLGLAACSDHEGACSSRRPNMVSLQAASTGSMPFRASWLASSSSTASSRSGC